MQPILAPNVGSQNGPNSGATRSPPVSGGPGPLCLIGTFFNGRLIGNCGALLAILSPYWQGWRLLGRVGNIFFFFFFSLLFFFFFSHPPSFFSFPFLSRRPYICDGAGLDKKMSRKLKIAVIILRTTSPPD